MLSNHRKRTQRGQALAEFAMIIGAFATIVIGAFYFGTILFQDWENGRLATAVGEKVTLQGQLSEQDVISKASLFNVDPTITTVVVTVTHVGSGGVVAPSRKYCFRGASSQQECPAGANSLPWWVNYGDYISVQALSDVNIPILSGFMQNTGGNPVISGNWHGITQLDWP